MGRAKRDGNLETRTARLRLPHRKEPYWSVLEEGRGLGYYRAKAGASGTWTARIFDTNTKARRFHRLGTADDLGDADGALVLNFAQAQLKAREWFAVAHLQATGEELHKGPFTVADAWESYHRDCVRRGVKRMDRMECAARLYILPELGGVEVERLTQTRIEKWHETMAGSAPRLRTKRLALKPATGAKPETDEAKRKRRASANRVLTILKSALNFAKRKRKVTCPADTWRETKPFGRVDAARVRYLNLDEQIRLVNACPPDFRRLVQGALFTGARFGELARLKVEDFNPVSGTVLFRETKAGKPRHVVLTEEGLAFFKDAVVGHPGDQLVFTHEAFGDMRRVIPKTLEPVEKVHRAWKAGDQPRPMKAACEAIGIAPMGFHQLRHSYASALVNQGVPLAFVAAQLGHSDTRMAEKHYAHLAPSAMAEAIRTLAPKLGIFMGGNVAALKLNQGGA